MYKYQKIFNMNTCHNNKKKSKKIILQIDFKNLQHQAIFCTVNDISSLQ